MQEIENENQDPTEVQLEPRQSQTGSGAQPEQNVFLSHEFLTLVIVFLLSVVVAGTYFWWQEIKKEQIVAKSCIPGTPPEECIDTVLIDPGTWKTYMNEEYRIEFKYPNDWRIDGNIQNGGFTIIKDTGNNSSSYRLYNLVGFKFYENSENLALKVFVNNKLLGNADKLEEIEINGVPVVKFSGFNMMNTHIPWTSACLAMLNKVFCFDSQEDNPGNISSMFEILSTFRFID